MKERVVIIVQARMTSTRLPGKVLKEVSGKALLAHQVDRMRRAKSADDIVVATTTNDTDIPVVELCKNIGVKYYRGPEDDVLARYHDAALACKADVIVRATADCPIIDSNVIDSVVSFYKDNRDRIDLVTSHSKDFLGISAEAFSSELLREMHDNATQPFEREHVTLYSYNRPERYKVHKLDYLKSGGHFRWTVDTPEDLQLIAKIFDALYKANNNFSVKDVLKLMKDHPDWARLNAHVLQRS